LCPPHSLQHLLDRTFGMRELLYIAGAQHHIHVGPCCGSKEARRSHRRGDAIRLAVAGVSAALGTIHLIAAGGVERLAAGAYPIFARLLLSAAPCFVFGFLWSFFQPTGDGVGQARDETIVHTEQSIERPATRDLVTRLKVSVSGWTVQMRRAPARPTVCFGHSTSRRCEVDSE